MSKILFALSVIGAILAAGGVYHTMTQDSTVVPQEVISAYNLWKQENYKLYSSESEDSYRLGVFADNYNKVIEHNAKGLEWELGMNQYADLTTEEFAKQFLGLNYKPQQERTEGYFPVTAETSVDWRTKGAVTGVKNQAQCGSCWAFSATGGLEGAYFLKTGTLESMSEQQLCDCSTKQGNMGCNGGLPESAFKYAKGQGMERESDYKYKAADSSCKYDASKAISGSTVSSYAQVPQADSDALANAVAQQPISIGIDAGGFGFQLYSKGIMNFRFCGHQLDHGVLIVGYGVEGSKKFWTVKNSWGATWGESGYFRITRKTGKGIAMCGLGEDATAVSM